MAINSNHVTGLVVGLGIAAVGFYAYKKNQAAVDDWLRQQGLQVPSAGVKDVTAMSLEELVTEKERLEDIIAEKEMAPMADNAAAKEEKSGKK
jgi:hypothetical protein